MPTGAGLAREISLLRELTPNLALRPSPSGPIIMQAFLRAEGIGLAQYHEGGLIAVMRPGVAAFAALSAAMIGGAPAMERGSIHANVRVELVKALAAYVGRDAASIGASDVSTLHDHLAAWFAALATPTRCSCRV